MEVRIALLADLVRVPDAETFQKVFGYASSKALTQAKHTNVGLRDQRLAFECKSGYPRLDQLDLTQWEGIRDNIGVFGGDPENVVAVGQSVGAMAIGLHLISYSGKRGVPFQKAM